MRVILKTKLMSQDLQEFQGPEKVEETEGTELPEVVQESSNILISVNEVPEYIKTETAVPEYTESTPTEPQIGWQFMRDYLSQSTEVLPEIKELMEKYKEIHAVKVYKSEDESQWELFLIHNSSLPTNQTCTVIRQITPDAGTVSSYGNHKWVKGTLEEVLAAIASL